jgi:hypothetical protein
MFRNRRTARQCYADAMTAATTTPSQDNLLELEIGAFMGPHIKRARIALVLIGILYAVTAYLSYDDIAKWHAAMSGASTKDARVAELKHLVDVAYFVVVFTGIAGVANIVLAAIGGTKTTFAMYAAMGIFAVHTAIQLYATEGMILTNWLWWITAIVIGMGFQAAYKAQALRKSRAPAEARLVA